MKKLFLLALSVIVMSAGSFAQSEKKRESQPMKLTESGKEAPSKTKKDGTPDKRYKENKETAAPAGPTKKDGTPDKRYKANKEATKK